MTESLIELLCAAAGDNNPNPDDAALAKEAEDWLLRHGWEPHWRLGLVNDEQQVAFLADAEGPLLMVLERQYRNWNFPGTGYRVRSLAGALNQLVLLGLLNPRFSTLGRDALHDHARVCERAAAAVDGPGDGAVLARAWREAADSARRLYPLKVPA